MNLDTSIYDKKVEDALDALDAALQERREFIGKPENNVFSSIEEAERVLEYQLEDNACDDCDGLNRKGLDTYTQEFIVGGKHYIANLNCEYKRNNMIHYYLSYSKISIEDKDLSLPA